MTIVGGVIFEEAGRRNKQGVLAALWRANQHCTWCHKKTVLPDTHKARGSFGEREDEASLKNVYSNYDSRRTKENEGPIVLACFECNQWRQKLETMMQPIEELWRRSRLFHLAMFGKPKLMLMAHVEMGA